MNEKYEKVISECSLDKNGLYCIEKKVFYVGVPIFDRTLSFALSGVGRKPVRLAQSGSPCDQAH